MVSGDSIWMVWSVNSGVSATVRKEAGALVGRAETFWDSRPEIQKAGVILTPVDCSSPPPLTRADQRPVPTSLTLEDGWVARLGEVFTGGPDWQRTTRSDRILFREDVEVQGVGVADLVEVIVRNDGTLSMIHLGLPPDFDIRALVQNLQGELGPPVSDHSYESPDGAQRDYVSWGNRTHHLSIGRERRPGHNWEVELFLSAEGRI
jgi:hypothetical protein